MIYLYSSGLPAQIWLAALVLAVTLKNRHWHSALGCTPYEGWTGNVPHVSYLRVFMHKSQLKIQESDLLRLTGTPPMGYYWVLVPLKAYMLL